MIRGTKARRKEKILAFRSPDQSLPQVHFLMRRGKAVVFSFAFKTQIITRHILVHELNASFSTHVRWVAEEGHVN